MKILYLHQYFKTPQEPGGTRSYWISRELLSRGHEVTMIAGRQNREKNREVKIIDGIKVVYFNAPYDNAMGMTRRVTTFLKFMFWSTWELLNQKKVDLVIVTSPPLSVGFPVLIQSLFNKAPFLFEVRDLWPEVLVQMGKLKNPILKKIAYAFEKQIYKKARHVVALSPGMKEGIVTTGVAPQKVSVISNMAKIDRFWPRAKDIFIFEKFKLNPTSFKVIYFGTLGYANGLDNFVNAAKLARLKHIEDIDFVLIGNGAMKIRYEEAKNKEEINHLMIHDTLPMDEISELVNACDVSYVGFSHVPVLKTNSSNKFFDTLSAGKPVIINYDGWMKDIIEKGECGIAVHPTDPDDLLKGIIALKENPETVKKMGQNARRLAETQYDKSILCRKFADVVEAIRLKPLEEIEID